MTTDTGSGRDMATDPRVRDVGEVRTEHLFDVVVDLNPPLDMGAGPFGRRILYGAAGGSFAGPRLRGEVVAGGGDWTLFRPDRAMTVDVRLTLRTHDDALVHVSYGGRWIVPAELHDDIADPVRSRLIDPARYYFRTAPLFETGSEKYAWLNDIVCVGSGYLVDGGVAYQVSRVL
ncbi:DUF3237 domain-containing protein [Nocardia sp. NPDC057030]|uniref:DUF3237 domain-containing protein n=1 Tax=unclassified Nocardia TaxID=2637762 RepID=UPI0036328977